MHPAARALHTGRVGNGDGEAGKLCAGRLRGDILKRLVRLDQAPGNDEQLGKIHVADRLQALLRGGILRLQRNSGLQRLADAFAGTRCFQNAVHVVAQADQHVPAGHLLIGKRVGGEGLIHLVQYHVAGIVFRTMRHSLPDLIAGEGEDRGKHLGKGIEDQEQGGLRAAALEAVRGFAVQPVLDDIEIETGKIHNTEVVDQVGDHMELIVAISSVHCLDQGIETRYGPAVQLQHIGGSNEVIGVKTGEVAQAVPGRIAELQIVLAELPEDVLGAAHVDMIVSRARPEAEQIGAELLHDLSGIHAVAERLVHGFALAVDGPAMGQAFLIRCTFAQRTDGDEQGGLEPAAVLVTALDIHRGGPEALIALHRGVVGGAGIEPAVQRVGLLCEGLAAAVRAGEACGEDRGSVAVEPCVAAFLLKQGGDGFDALFGADGLAAVLAVEHGDGEAPAALTGDAPVAALTDHGAHTLLAPGGQPAHGFTGCDRFVFE